jgi:integrase
MADGTVRKYVAAADHYLAWLGEADPAAQRRTNLEGYLDEWYAESTPSPGTVRVRIAALAKFYDFLDSNGVLVDRDGRELRNPLDRVRRPRSRPRGIDWLTPEEDRAVLDAPINPQECIVIALLRWTGLRVGEACALTWADVDEVQRFLRVRTSKTESGVRAVTLLPELEKELSSWRTELERRELFDRDLPVLVTKHGTAMKPQFAWRLVKRVCARAGVRARPAKDASGFNVSAVTPHTFRRTLATDLLNRGLRLEAVSKTLGHADTRVTATYYAEMLDPTTRDEMLEAMARRSA